jgi:hypothetical protein
MMRCPREAPQDLLIVFGAIKSRFFPLRDPANLHAYRLGQLGT